MRFHKDYSALDKADLSGKQGDHFRRQVVAKRIVLALGYAGFAAGAAFSAIKHLPMHFAMPLVLASGVVVFFIARLVSNLVLNRGG